MGIEGILQEGFITTTADKLKALPAPKVSGGEEFASKTIPLLSEVGTTFSVDLPRHPVPDTHPPGAPPLLRGDAAP